MLKTHLSVRKTNPLKIAFIVHVFPALSETFILNQIISLIDLGHEVEIFAETASSEHIVHVDVEKYNLMATVHYLPVIPKNRFLRKLKILLFVTHQFIRHPLRTLKNMAVAFSCLSFISHSLLYLLYCIPKEKFDIVHCHFGHYGLVGIALKRAGVKSKIVTEFHGQDLSIISKYKKPVRDKLFRECDLFLTVCEYFKKKLIEFGCNSDKIICHHTGIYLNKFNFRTRRLPGKDSIKILTIGRLVEKKGVDYSVRAVAKLLESCEKIEYTIVGAGPLEQQLRTLVSELRIDGKVNFVGTMAHDQLINLYDRSHIFVLSSVTAGDGDHEGIPNALKEAMASGLVVVSTYHSGIDELIVDNVSGLLAPEKNVDALTDKLEYLIEHPEVWAEIGRNARVAVEENFDSEKLSKKLESIYNQLLTSTENAEIR